MLLAGWLAIALVVGALAVRGLAAPGPYYDEAWLAQQARIFVAPARAGSRPPGTQSIDLFGRPFPLFALPYLGSLKSQLMIPAIAVFGPSLATVRLWTVATALAALLATMLAARRVLGTFGIGRASGRERV